MMQFKKARIGLAMFAALAGGLTATSTASAAAAISENGVGQALIFPYYSVRDGFESLFNITNTSAETIAVKVRFRESHNSRDVLDFNLVLSPHDVWTGRLMDSAAGPVLKSNDNSCTSPQMTAAGFTAQSVGYTGSFNDQGDTSIDRTREGYVEVIMMGRTNAPTGALGLGEVLGVDRNPLAYNAKHVAGEPRDCSAVNKMFVAGSMTGSTAKALTAAAVPTDFNGATTNTADYGDQASGDPGARAYLSAPCTTAAAWASGTANGDLDNSAYTTECLNPLKGNFTLYKPTGGVAGGTTAIAIEDWAEDATTDLVTAQQYPYFLEPTLASGDGLWTVTDLGTAPTAGGILALLQRNAMTNEWGNNATTGAGMDWVISMPLKNFFVDIPADFADKATTNDSFTDNNFQAAVNSARGYDMTATGINLTAVLTGAAVNGLVPGFNSVFKGTSAVTVDYSIYDREEGSVTINETVVSPAPPGTVQSLKYEVNVLTFDGVKNLSSEVASNVSIPAGLKTKNGWIKADISTGSIPAVGFAWKTRNFGDKAANFGQILEHGYE